MGVEIDGDFIRASIVDFKGVLETKLKEVPGYTNIKKVGKLGLCRERVDTEDPKVLKVFYDDPSYMRIAAFGMANKVTADQVIRSITDLLFGGG